MGNRPEESVKHNLGIGHIRNPKFASVCFGCRELSDVWIYTQLSLPAFSKEHVVLLYTINASVP